MSQKESLHPQLLELFSKNDEGKGEPTALALAVLNQLIQSGAVTTEAVKSAYETVQVTTQLKLNVTGKKSETKLEPQHRYRHIALRVYYDGAEYSGLAQNMGQENDQSVEKALFQALVKTRLVESRETSGYSRCGRTDKGVSAAGQVVGLRLRSNIPLQATYEAETQTPVLEEQLPKNASERIRVCVPPKKGDGSKVCKDVAEYPYDKMLNNVLPVSIRVLGWCPVSNDFSARFSATARTYRYFFTRRRLDLEKMREALPFLVGKHDFRNFCKMDVEKVYNFERQIHSAELVTCSEQSVCYLQIVGQAFLWHQIRCIVSVLFLVGQGLEEPSIVKDLLNVEEQPGKPSYPLAADRPLVLHHCGHPNLKMGYSTQNLWHLSCQMEQQWEELVIAAARVRNCLESLQDATVMRSEVLEFTRNKLKERDRKGNKHKALNGGASAIDLQMVEESLSRETTLSWGQALDWMARWECFPGPNGVKEIAHIPLLQRSRGTTYEEKVEAVSKSKRRQQKYEENVIKKRKTAEEDAAFYNHMTNQGGTGI
jgi:tRNA pseudouridine38/39 synthase